MRRIGACALIAVGLLWIRATIAYTPEDGKAIKRRKTVVLKKKRR